MVEKENDIAATAPTGGSKSENGVAANKVGNSLPETNESLKVLAFQFFEAYYTKLSDHPDDIGAFYGDDSELVTGDIVATGREDIQRTIGNMRFGDCKSRFYSVKAARAIDDSKVFQVCGELTLKGQAAPRRFCQTIVLSCAPPNVLYVKSNIFQWLEEAFPQSDKEKIYFISPPTTLSISQQSVVKKPEENGGIPVTTNANMTLKKNPVETTPPPQQPMLNGGSMIPNHDHVVQLQSQQSVSVPPVSSPQPPPITASQVVQESSVLTMASPPGLKKNMPESLQQHTNATPPVKSPKKPLTQVNNEIVSENLDNVKIDQNNVTANEKVTANDVKKIEVTKEEEAPTMLKPPTPPPTAHQPPEQFKAKPESKSWNKVVSGGQNKQQQFPPTSNVMHSAGNRAPAMTTTTAIRAAPPAIVENNSAKSHVPPPPIQATSTVQKPSSPESVVSPNQNPQYNATEKITSPPPVEKSVKFNEGGNQPQVHPHVAPRKDWPHRIYFSNLSKPGHFVDFKAGQQELMKEVLGITEGVEFVGIKPVSLRKEYKTAFGFIDFTTPEDMQAVYNVAQKDIGGSDNKAGGSGYRLKVRIPTFGFDGYLTLGSDKTNNLGFMGGGQKAWPKQNYTNNSNNNNG